MAYSHFDNQSIIKKNPVVIVKNFIVLQLTAVALFFLSGVLLDYGEIYEHLPIPGSFSFHIVEAIGIFFLETIIVFYIFFRWHKEYYNIKDGQIIHSKGIIFNNKEMVPINSIRSINYKQGPLGRLTKYGHIELKNDSDKPMIIDHLSDPQLYVELLTGIRNSLQRNNNIATESVVDTLSKGENEYFEFKSSFRWDFNQNKVNKNLEKSVMKTIAAFMNSEGGRLAVGVNDSGHVIGLENDFNSLPKKGIDGFQNHFNNIFNEMIGPEFRHLIELIFDKNNDRYYCLARIAPANRPVYLKSEKEEEFYIRTGNGTTSLKLSEAAAYADSKWKTKLL